MSAVVSLIVQKYGTRIDAHNYAVKNNMRLSSVSQDIEPTVKRQPTNARLPTELHVAILLSYTNVTTMPYIPKTVIQVV